MTPSLEPAGELRIELNEGDDQTGAIQGTTLFLKLNPLLESHPQERMCEKPISLWSPPNWQSAC